MPIRPGSAGPLTYTAAQAADRIGGKCKATWLKAQARNGKIPYIWLGGAYHFTEEHIAAILALLERRPAETAPEPRRKAARPRPAAAAPAPAPAGDVIVLRARTPRTRLA